MSMNPRDRTDLQALHRYTEEKINNWRERWPEVPKQPPWPADAPCYYCDFVEGDSGAPDVNACDFCVHNPDALIYQWSYE